MSDRDDLPIDAILLLSFGGPEGPDEVVPFLQNVTRGRNIPEERLKVVGEHYYHFGGVSPINEINRGIQQRLHAELRGRGIDLPVYWGNRNWHPMLEDTVTAMVADGIQSALVFATSAYGGYSACRQYHEDIARARESVAHAPRLEKLPQTYLNELFIEANADAVAAALAELGGEDWSDIRLVFTAHSVPMSAEDEAGVDGHLYTEQLHWVAGQVAERVGAADFDLVYQSRSGAPHVPWLEPDIEDHLRDLHERAVRAVVIAPIGFVSDHLEVVWDLDTQARQVADELGMAMARAGTASADPRFITMYADLIARRIRQDAVVRELVAPLQGCTGVGVNGTLCAPYCCGPKPADT
ncbi:ferrochelatase [Epidermidibacterium keratini]|uniref:Coproporphyrin III ferrochelatase n=1 Tax=Epidermidibacterium keratini TaxID=1891644 RepID=A0A7L4YU79_9ACTN|nr:ferrochelatase [Epidermidibacterium keratini]